MKMYSIIRTALMAGTLVVVSASAPAGELVFGSYLPPKHNVNTQGLEPLFKELKPKINWKLVSGGQLFSGNATLKSVGNRVADAGIVIPAYVQSALKNAFLSMDLMFVADDSMVANAAMLDTFFFDCPQCLADYHKAKTVLLGTYGLDGYSLMCRDPAITTIGDIKGKRIRTTGALGRFTVAFGGSPVAMSSGDMVEAISRGQIDCIFGAIAWLKAYPIEDSIRSIIEIRTGATTVDLFVMNRQSWKALTREQQLLMLRKMPGAVARTTVAGYFGDDAKAQRIAKKMGIPFHAPDKKFASLYDSFRKKEIAVVIERAKKRGAKDPEKIVEAIFRNYEKWNKLIGAQDRSNLKTLTDKYAKLLWEHIYSKVDPAKL
jgi:TRAP-type C4-dicarboxylate transport system substrate-binding protein